MGWGLIPTPFFHPHLPAWTRLVDPPDDPHFLARVLTRGHRLDQHLADELYGSRHVVERVKESGELPGGQSHVSHDSQRRECDAWR